MTQGKVVLTEFEEIMLTALDHIDTHGIAVEESTQDELIEFIAELKQMANDALVKVGARLPINSR